MGDSTRTKLKRLYEGTYEFLTEKWIETHEESSRLQRFGQFWVLVFKSFSRNRCPVRATALAYTTLLALVPLLAVVLSITSSLLQEKGEAATKQIIVQFVDAAVPQLRLLPPDPPTTNKVAVTNAQAGAAAGSVTNIVVSTNAESVTAAGPGTNVVIIPGQAPHEKVVNQIYEFMANIKVKTLGATGMAGLVMIAIMLLSTIEGTFNDIWGVTHGRSWPRRVVQYWAAISLGPIALALAVVLAQNTYSRSAEESKTAAPADANKDGVVSLEEVVALERAGLADNQIIARLDATDQSFELTAEQQRYLLDRGVSRSVVDRLPKLNRGWLEKFDVVGQFFVWVVPFIYVSIAFALFYKLMPNTQVHWRAAAIGGVVGGSLWLMLNLVNTFFLTRVITFSNIYGPAMALLPIFLLGLYFSWVIMLFGAQVAYAFQNRTVYVQEKRAESVGQRAREYIALRIMTFLARRFEHGESPPTILEVADQLGVSSRLIGRILQPLMDYHLVHEVAVDKESGYAPARPVDTITCCDVLTTLRGISGTELQTRDDGTRDLVCREFERIEEAERRAAHVSLKELIERVGDQDLKREQVTRGMVEAMAKA